MELQQQLETIKALIDEHTTAKPYDVLKAVDLLTNAHGVESIRDGSGSSDGEIVADYVNMGDTYNITLLYCHLENKYRVTSWGSYVENNPICEDWHESASQLAQSIFSCLVSNQNGIYTAQRFAEVHGSIDGYNLDGCDLEALLAGPDHEDYDYVWDEVSAAAERTTPDNKVMQLHLGGSGDVFEFPTAAIEAWEEKRNGASFWDYYGV